MIEKVPELTNGEFEEFTKSGLVLIDFFAEWCMPCLMMAPVLEELAESMKGKVKVGKVDVSESEPIARKFNVSSIPNFTIIKDGKVMEHIIGSASLEELEDKLKQYI